MPPWRKFDRRPSPEFLSAMADPWILRIKAKTDGWSTTHASYPCERQGACTLFLDAKPKFADFGVEITELNTPHFDTLGCIIVNFVKVGKNVKMLYYYKLINHWFSPRKALIKPIFLSAG